MDGIEAIIEWFKQLFKDAMEFLLELPLRILDGFLTAIVSLFSSIPVPEFIEAGLQPLFAPLPPSIIFFVDQLGIPEGLLIFGGGVAFRLARKFFTLFQW